MPRREKPPVGAPCWVDLMTSDVEGSRAFYTELFGWEALEPSPEFGGYFMFAKDGTPVAGCIGNPGALGIPDRWSVHLATDDLDKTIESAQSAGGQVLAPAAVIADLGSMVVLSDPGGAAFGAWQPQSFDGFGIIGEHGAPSWFELATHDYDKAVGFYRDLFRLDVTVVNDGPDFRYSVLKSRDEELAGIMDASGMMPPEIPSHWAVYFGCDDADETSATITKLGGTITRSAEDTPYGRLASAVDPGGVAFKLVAANDQMPPKSA
jgi:uncharacterized protein